MIVVSKAMEKSVVTLLRAEEENAVCLFAADYIETLQREIVRLKEQITGKSEKERPEWYDYAVYRKTAKEAVIEFVADKEAIENLKESHPGVDIIATIKKSYLEFWRTEDGWNRKKSSKTKTIDWPATYRKACRMPFNQVIKSDNKAEIKLPSHKQLC